MRVFTAAEVAERIAREGEDDLELVADRIRSWTKDGLLETAGERKPGRGRSRSYPEKALIEAMVLRELMDSLGVQPGKAYPYAQWFGELKHSLGKKFNHQFDQRPGEADLLVFSRGTSDLHHEPVCWFATRENIFELLKPPFASHVIINLSALQQQLNQAEKS